MGIVTACATANNNIGEAWRMIKFGDADAFVAGGAEAIDPAHGPRRLWQHEALSTRNDEPERASRPFDKDRDGFVMGEGAGVVVIEELGAREEARRAASTANSSATASSPMPTTSPRRIPKARAPAVHGHGPAPRQAESRGDSTTSTPTAPPPAMGDVCETAARSSAPSATTPRMASSSAPPSP